MAEKIILFEDGCRIEGHGIGGEMAHMVQELDEVGMFGMF